MKIGSAHYDQKFLIDHHSDRFRQGYVRPLRNQNLIFIKFFLHSVFCYLSSSDTACGLYNIEPSNLKCFSSDLIDRYTVTTNTWTTLKKNLVFQDNDTAL